MPSALVALFFFRLFAPGTTTAAGRPCAVRRSPPIARDCRVSPDHPLHFDAPAEITEVSHSTADLERTRRRVVLLLPPHHEPEARAKKQLGGLQGRRYKPPDHVPRRLELFESR